MRKLLYPLLTIGFIFSVIIAVTPHTVSAAVNYNRIIDDSVFSNSNKMSAAQIDSFLNSFPSSCISKDNNFKSPEPTGYSPSGGFKFGSNVSAGQVIYVAAKVYGLNPQVILSTLQKEQSLVSGGAGCHPNTPNPSNTFQCNLWGDGNIPCTSACPYSGGCVPIALGYNCPGNCQASSEGFSQQIIRATWKLKFNQQRSLGNTGWDVQLNNFPHSGNVWDNSDDPGTRYNGPMTQGYRKRISTDPSTTYYDGYTTIDGASIHMDTGGTAALYYYTPHKSGNLNFYNIFSGWFGNPSTDTSRDRVFVGDWDGDGKQTPAIKRGHTYFFDNNNDGISEKSYPWGKDSDLLLVGDWDGDGKDDIGLKRGNKFFFDYGANGITDKTIASWGRPTDSVIIGDWDGDGKTDIGLRRGNQFFLDYGNNGTADISYSWGRPTDSVIVGDWDGDGKVDIGLKRSNQFFFDYGNNGTTDKHIGAWGWPRSGDKTLVGDWDGDGKVDIGLKRDNTFSFDFGSDGSTDKYFAAWGWPRSGDEVVIGDWNNDGKSSVGLRRSCDISLDYDLDGITDSNFVYTF